MISMAVGASGTTSVAQRPYVVAHWIVPMQYNQGEPEAARVKNDIRSALEEGLDGFAINAFTGSQAKGLLAEFISAADELNARTFKVFLSADMSLGFKPSEIIGVIEEFGANPHYLSLKGRPLLSTYGQGNLDSNGWLHEVLGPLEEAGRPVTFVPYFDRPSPNGDDPSYDIWRATIRRYPVVDGLFNFLIPKALPFYTGDVRLGNHKWSTLEGEENLSKALHDEDKIFIGTYMPYYWAACHPARQYMEYQGGRGMDNTWTSIIERQKPEAVELITWNDYSESTYIQPTRIPLTKTENIESYPHLGYYELLKYYISWYKSRTRPKIAEDALFYFYRPNFRKVKQSTKDTACGLGPVQDYQIWGNLLEKAYVTTATASPAELRVKSGNTTATYHLQAGITMIDVPLSEGPLAFEMLRGGRATVHIQAVEVRERGERDNFNMTSGYATSAGGTSDTWAPSDRWRDGYVAEWLNPVGGR